MSQARCFGLHEAHDIGSGEPMKLDFAFAEDRLKESSDSIAIQTNRGSGEPTLAQPMLLKRLSNPSSGRYCCGRCRRVVLSRVGTKTSESLERVGVTASAPSLQPPIVKVLGSMARLHAAGLDLALIEPSHEIENQPHRRLDRRRGVSLGQHLL